MTVVLQHPSDFSLEIEVGGSTSASDCITEVLLPILELQELGPWHR